jgi:polysaccharide chain length determinant protein (PEP-CTERM system associated)
MGAILTLLRRSLKSAWRRRWLGVAIAWVVCLLGWIGVSLVPNEYQAYARLYVNTDAVLTPLLKNIAVDASPDQELRVLQATLLSRPNVETLISKTDLDLTVSNPDQRDALVNRLMEGITVKPDPKLNVFSIQYSDPHPKLARDVVQTLLTIFIDNATGGNRREMENARIFLEHQISSYEQQLRSSEQRRAEFRAKYPDVALVETDAGDASGVNNPLATLQQHVLDTQNTLQDKIALVAALKKELDGTPPMLPGLAIGGPGAPTTLAGAEERLQMLRLQYTDQYPGVIAAQRQVDALKASPHGGGAADRSTPNPAYESLRLRIIDLDAEISSLQRQLTALQDQQTKFEQLQRERPNLVAEYQNLDRGYAVLRKNYDELLGRLQSANIGEAADTQADQVQIRIIDPPDIPRIPYAPNRVLLVSVVLAVGLIAGLVVPVLLAQLDRSFWVVEDLRSLGLPVLGGISMLAAIPWRRRIMTVTSFAIALIVLLGLYGGLMIRLLHGSAVV